MPPQNSDENNQLATPAEPALASPVVDEEADHYVPPADPANPEEAALDEHRMTLLERLAELRLRLRNAAIAFVLAMFASFYFVVRFFEVLTRPVRTGMIKAGFPPEISIMKVTEPFWVYTKLAIIAGLL